MEPLLGGNGGFEKHVLALVGSPEAVFQAEVHDAEDALARASVKLAVTPALCCICSCDSDGD